MADRLRLRPDDLVRAVVELGLARLQLKRHRPRLGAASQNAVPLNDRQSALVDRVALVIPRVAARMPWRADCLVQAMAAQRWLSRARIATSLTLGVPKDRRPAFEAHAWLSAGSRIVTGGDVSDYIPLARP